MASGTIKCSSLKREFLGYKAINGSSAVTLTTDSSMDAVDFIFVGNSYYNQGVASYGELLLPRLFARTEAAIDAGATYIDESGVRIKVRFNKSNEIIFTPQNGGTPTGAYYYAWGYKLV